MNAINTLLWQLALIILLACIGVSEITWMVSGMVLMFWLIVVSLAIKEVSDG